MSSSFPVPSKGALRALRHVALGTSCTVAFGAGLITEDRRRRLHTAREASENARRLKASRKYHSAGLSAAATFEDQVENYFKYGPWKGGEKQKLLDPDSNDPHYNEASTSEKRRTNADASIIISRPVPTKLRRDGRTVTSEVPKKQPSKLVEYRSFRVGHASLWVSTDAIKVGDSKDSITWKPSETQNINKAENEILNSPVKDFSNGEAWPVRSLRSLRSKDSEIRAQTELATQIAEVLRDVDTNGVGAIMEAVSTFHGAFQGEMLVQVISQNLLDACILLGQKCDYYDCLDMFIPVLSKILDLSKIPNDRRPIDEGSLYKLQFMKVIARLLEKSGYRHADHATVLDDEQLKHAVDIFRAKTIEHPKPLPMELRDIGLHLCTATFRANLNDLTEKVYWRLSCSRTDSTASEVECLILAQHRQALHGQVLHHFLKFFSRTVPNQDQLYSVVSAGVDSALELGSIDKAEEILSTANRMAREGNMNTSTTWYLRVLGEHWRTGRNLATTQALFGRLASFIEHTNRPQAIYSAMIQFCVEAGNDREAKKYLAHLSQQGDEHCMDVRTYGHLALAKAMKNDWKGVEADFRFMQRLGKGSTRDHSDIFVPIFKIFVSSHNIGQVEDFVRIYIEHLDVKPNQYIFNVMIHAYGKAGEFNNIPQWIEYMHDRGFQINAVTFNSILSRCQKQWGMHSDDLIRIYNETIERVGFIFDSTMIRMLRRAAYSSATPCHAMRLAQQIKHPIGIKFDETEEAMQRAANMGDHMKVVDIYKRAMRSRRRILPEWFSIAVKASINSTADGHLATTARLIDDAQSRGFDIQPSMARLLLHQVNTSKHDGDELLSLINNVLAAFDRRGLIVTLPLATKVISEVMNRGMPLEALTLWSALAGRDQIARQPLDLVLLSVLLRAHIKICNLQGIKWVMNVLLENNITPDMQFRKIVKHARQLARRELNAQPDSFQAKRRLEVLNECMQLIISQRLNAETKRKEAEELILSIAETALVAEPDSVREKSRTGPGQVLHVKRSEERKRLKKMVHHNETERNPHPENAALLILKNRENVREKVLNAIQLPQDPDTRSLNQEAASLLESKQELSGCTESNMRNINSYHESASRTVVVASA